MHTTSLLRAAALVLLVLLSTACTASSIQAPNGYVLLPDDQLRSTVAHKAVSSDGTVIVVRERDHEPTGKLDFWTQALEREVTQGRGYTLLEQQDITAKGNRKGKLLKFKGNYNQRTYRYDIALFITEDHIVTVETAAPEDLWDAHKDAFKTAIRSLEIDD